METFVIITILIIIYISYEKFKQKEIDFINEKKRSILRKSYSIIQKHKKQLAIQRIKSCYIDDYGKEIITKKWYDKEIPHFIRHHIYPELDQVEMDFVFGVLGEITEKIEKVAKNQKIDKLKYDEKMNGFEFEIFCAEKLKKEGWNVRKTKNGSDQGVDLIISKGKRKIAVQCKKYARPIGNKAVQEVKSGMSYYNLNEGIVIANNRFTKSAIELANPNGIQLIHFLETNKI